MDFGIEGLKLLRVNLGGALGPKIGQQLLLTQIALRKQDVFDFSNLPPMKNEESAQLIEMLMIVSTPAFLTNKDLFVLIALRMFRITLRDGITGPGLFAIQNYAVVTFVAFKAAARACKLERAQRRTTIAGVRGRQPSQVRRSPCLRPEPPSSSWRCVETSSDDTSDPVRSS